MRFSSQSRLPGILGVSVIVLIFLSLVCSFHPRELLDFHHDDAIYLNTAKALANGSGYILPSFPGVLPQTKYPVLYPLILSTVWQLEPTFPASLRLAITLTLAIAAIYIVLAYLLLRRLGTSLAISLGITAALALHPWVSFLAGSLLSDYLFAALILASSMAADAMCDESKNVRAGILAGFILGLAMLARSAAIGAIVGVVLYGLRRRCWRPLAASLVVCAAIVSFTKIAIRIHTPSYVPAGQGTPPVGFQHVLVYYSSYLRMWLLSVPDRSAFLSMLWNNLRKLMLAPGNYFIMGGFTFPSNLITNAAALLVSVLSLGGILRWSVSTRKHSILYMSVGTLPVLLLWNYAVYDRFLLPFMPIIMLGIVTELRRIFALLASASRSGVTNRAAAALVVSIFITLISISVYNYWNFRQQLIAFVEHRVALNRERREAYDWISRNTSKEARILAYEDGLVYLYTGRQAVRPVSISTDCYYQPERPKCASDYSEMGTWTDYAGTRYWLMDSDDLKFEGVRRFRPEVQAYISGLKARMRAVFVSSGHSVVIFDTTCLNSSNAPDCASQSRFSSER